MYNINNEFTQNTNLIQLYVVSLRQYKVFIPLSPVKLYFPDIVATFLHKQGYFLYKYFAGRMNVFLPKTDNVWNNYRPWHFFQ